MSPTADDVFNDSYSSSSYSYFEVTDPGPETVFVPVVWSVIIAVGVSTNVLVVYVVLFHMKMTTVTNYYIVNLALTDISFLMLCIPFTILNFTLHGYLTQGMCMVIAYVQQASVHATCMTLTLMSCDRYFAIVYPIKSMKYRTRRLSFLLNLGVWILSYLMAIPAAIYAEHGRRFYYVGKKSFCYESGLPRRKIIYYTYVVVCSYIIPLTIITVCYSLLLRAMWTRNNPTANAQNERRNRRNLNQKKRLTRMLLVVVLLFFVCWLPLHVLNSWERYGDESGSFPSNSVAVYYAKIVAMTLAYSNSCVNPFVYAFMGNNFRTSFRNAFTCCFRRQLVGQATTSGSTRRGRLLQRRGTEDGATRITVMAEVDLPPNRNNNTNTVQEAQL